jgi:hypothetical protein
MGEPTVADACRIFVVMAFFAAALAKLLRPLPDPARPFRLILPGASPRALGLLPGVVIGAELLATAGMLVSFWFRLAAVPGVVTSAAALVYLRRLQRVSPGTGCGCAGRASRHPISWRSYARGGLLFFTALIALGGTHGGRQNSWTPTLIVAALVLVGVALSDELRPRARRKATLQTRAAVAGAHSDCANVLTLDAVWARVAAAVREELPAVSVPAATPEAAWRNNCWSMFVAEASTGTLYMAVSADGGDDSRLVWADRDGTTTERLLLLPSMSWDAAGSKRPSDVIIGGLQPSH